VQGDVTVTHPSQAVDLVLTQVRLRDLAARNKALLAGEGNGTTPAGSQAPPKSASACTAAKAGPSHDLVAAPASGDKQPFGYVIPPPQLPAWPRCREQTRCGIIWEFPKQPVYILHSPPASSAWDRLWVVSGELHGWRTSTCDER